MLVQNNFLIHIRFLSLYVPYLIILEETLEIVEIASQTFPTIIIPREKKHQPTISSSSPAPINKQIKLYKLELPAHKVYIYTIHIPPTYDNMIIISNNDSKNNNNKQ